MSVIEQLRDKVFNTVIIRGLQPSFLDTEGVPREEGFRRERIRPSLVLMSRESEREIMREDYGNMTGILTPVGLTEPRRVYGVRVAFDDSLAVGEFLVAETVA